MKKPTGAQSIERTFTVLKEIARHHKKGISLTELTRSTGLNKATVYRLLLMMKVEGMIEQDPHMLCYHLGPLCYSMGKISEDRFGIINLAYDSVTKLAKHSYDVAFLSIRKGLNVVCVLREDGDYPVRSHVLQPGTQTPLGVHSSGLAMLSAMPHDEVQYYLKDNAKMLNEKFPKLNYDKILYEIKSARELGYAINPGLVVEGSWGIGVPIRSSSGEVIAALSIAAIESRMKKDRQRELGNLLKKEAKLLEARLKKIEVIS